MPSPPCPLRGRGESSELHWASCCGRRLPLAPKPAGGRGHTPTPARPCWAMHYPQLGYCIARVPERVRGVMIGVLPSRELGACASGAHGAGTSAKGRSQAQAPAPGGIHGRPGQMIEPNVYPIRKPSIKRLPSPLPPPGAMHDPQLVLTTCVSAGMIAMGAVVGD